MIRNILDILDIIENLEETETEDLRVEVFGGESVVTDIKNNSFIKVFPGLGEYLFLEKNTPFLTELEKELVCKGYMPMRSLY